MLVQQQPCPRSERLDALPGVVKATSSDCSSGASPSVEASGRDRPTAVPSPPALPSGATAADTNRTQPQGIQLGWPRGAFDDHSPMATQQLLQQQQQQQQLQQHVASQRIDESRLEGGIAANLLAASATCKQSSSSSFNDSPTTNMSASQEPREDPLVPSAGGPEHAGAGRNRLLRLVQRQLTGGRSTGLLQRTPDQGGGYHQGEEEVASQQKAAVPAQRAENSSASAGQALRDERHSMHPSTEALAAGGSAEAAVRRPSHNTPTGQSPADAASTHPGDAHAAPTSSLVGIRPDQSARSTLSSSTGGSLLQGAQPSPALASPNQPHRTGAHLLQSASSTTGPGAASLSGLQPSQLSPHPQQQLQQLRMQQQQMLQGQRNPLGQAASPAATGAGFEAQVRARLGLPPKRNVTLGPAAGAGAIGMGGMASQLAPSGGAPDPRAGSLGDGAGALGSGLGGQGVRLRLLAQQQQQQQHHHVGGLESSPSFSGSAAASPLSSSSAVSRLQGAGTGGLLGGPQHLHAHQHLMGATGGVHGGGTSDMLLASSPAILQAQQSLNHPHLQLHQGDMRISQQQQQQNLAVRQALLRSASSAVASPQLSPVNTLHHTPGAGAFAGSAGSGLGGLSNSNPLERACSAPQAAMETQVAAMKLRKLEQLGISASQALMAAAQGRFSGPPQQQGQHHHQQQQAQLPQNVQQQLQQQQQQQQQQAQGLMSRSGCGYVTTASGSPSEAGSPMHSRSFKRSAGWEEQQLLQQQQQSRLASLNTGGLPLGRDAGAGFDPSSGLAGQGSAGMVVSGQAGGGLDALQALKRRAYGSEGLGGGSGRSLSSRQTQMMDPQGSLMVCRSVPDDIHSQMAMNSGMNSASAGFGFGAGGSGFGGGLGGGGGGLGGHPAGILSPGSGHMGGGAPRLDGFVAPGQACGTEGLPLKGGLGGGSMMGSSLDRLGGGMGPLGSGPGGGMGLGGMAGGLNAMAEGPMGLLAGGPGMGLGPLAGGGMPVQLQLDGPMVPAAGGFGPLGGGMGDLPMGPPGGMCGPQGAGMGSLDVGMGMAGMGPVGMGMPVGTGALGPGGPLEATNMGMNMAMGGSDGLGPTPMGAVGGDSAMDLADLGTDQDYLADNELQSFIAELCAPNGGGQDGATDPPGRSRGVSVSGGARGSAGTAGRRAGPGADVQMAEGGVAGSGGGAMGMRVSGGGVAGSAGGGRRASARNLALDEEQRALQTEAEALLNFQFD